MSSLSKNRLSGLSPFAGSPGRWIALRECDANDAHRGIKEKNMGLILLVILLLLVIGSLPTWPYSSGWGYYPTGGLGLILLIILILVLLRRI
jgi:hypothetical protein